MKESGFLRPREVMPLYFSSIISEISERRHRQRPELSSCSCLFAASGLQEFQSLAPDLFSPRARKRFPEEVSKPPKAGIQGGQGRAGIRDRRFRGGDEGEEGGTHLSNSYHQAAHAGWKAIEFRTISRAGLAFGTTHLPCL